MSERLLMLLSVPAGALLGALFFGGLWWTVKRGVTSKRPGLLFAGSLLVRSALAVAGIYVVGHGQWERLLLCLVGFLVARFAVTRLTRAPYGEGARRAVRRRRAPPLEYTDSRERDMGPGEQEVRRAPEPR